MLATMDVEIKATPELRVAAMRHIGPYTHIGTAFQRLGAIAGPAGLLERPGVRMIGIYYDDPEATPQEQLRADAGIVVAEDLALPADLTEARVPAGRYAVTLVVGPYEQLPDAWRRLHAEWLPESGHRAAPGPSCEIYRNTSMTVPPAQLETELWMPVA